MTNYDLLNYFNSKLEQMSETMRNKNHDYSAGDDPFANFNMIENCGIITTEQGFLTRMMDKIGRVNSFCKQGVLNVKSENIEDTLLDLANYSILLSAYIKDKQDKHTEKLIDIANGNY